MCQTDKRHVTSGWSAPSAIGIAGLGGGFEIGVEVSDTESLYD